MQVAIVLLNVAVSRVSATAGALALFRPNALLARRVPIPETSFIPLAQFRFAIAAGLLPFFVQPPGVASLFLVAAAIHR
jgi:hypothetical protein